MAPHLPLWNGLRRDEPEPEPGPFDTHMVHDNIGPAYHRAIPRLARHLAHGIMQGLQIDLIFCDGIREEIRCRSSASLGKQLESCVCIARSR